MKSKKVEIEDSKYKKHIGNKLKLARINANLTQEQLAEKLSYSPKYISQLERGQAFGSAYTLINLCKILNISGSYLFDDLLDIDTPNELPPIDMDFLKIYIQLPDYDKDIVNIISEQILKYSKNNKLYK